MPISKEKEKKEGTMNYISRQNVSGKPTTVGNLIHALKDLDPETKVYFNTTAITYAELITERSLLNGESIISTRVELS